MQLLTTLNLLVPAEGTTNVMAMTLPGDVSPAPNPTSYTVDFQSIAQQLNSTIFIPQAVTVDASQLATGTTLTFAIPALNWERVIDAGTTVTFQFPAIQPLVVTITPSTGTPSFNVYWYNYPAMPDQGPLTITSSSAVAVSVIVTSMPPVIMAGSIGVDHSANAPATPANLLLTIAANPARLGYLIQNQDTVSITVVLDDGAGGQLSKVILQGAPAAGGQGGSLDYTGAPCQGRIRVYSSSAASPVMAREF